MITREYTVLMQDPNTKVIPYVFKSTSEKEMFAWLESVSKKEKFKGLIPLRSSRLLIMNRRINFHNAVMWLNIILLGVLIFKLVSL